MKYQNVNIIQRLLSIYNQRWKGGSIYLYFIITSVTRQ